MRLTLWPTLMQIHRLRRMKIIFNAVNVVFLFLLIIQSTILVVIGQGLLPQLLESMGLASVLQSNAEIAKLTTIGQVLPSGGRIALIMSSYIYILPYLPHILLGVAAIGAMVEASKLAKEFRRGQEIMFWATLPVSRGHWVISAWLCLMLSMGYALLMSGVLIASTFAVSWLQMLVDQSTHALPQLWYGAQTVLLEVLPKYGWHLLQISPLYALLILAGIVLRWRPIMLCSIALSALAHFVPQTQIHILLATPVVGYLQAEQSTQLLLPSYYAAWHVGASLVMLLLAAQFWRQRLQ